MSNAVTLPIVVVSSTLEGSDSFIHPNQLPSAGFKYYRWHELEDNGISSNELKFPRVRKAPTSLKVELQDTLVHEKSEDDDKKISDPEKQNNKNTHENWKQCGVVNLSYQDLGNEYQIQTFTSLLKKLNKSEEINISHNELSNLQSYNFSACKVLNLQNNYLKSFKELPSIPKVVHLNLTENNISKLSGIEKLKHVETLTMVRNPVQYTINYRARVFKKLPKLKVLDGIPKLEEDVMKTK